MRENKFRAWHKIDNEMMDWKSIQRSPYMMIGTLISNEYANIIPMQFTGVKDNKCNEIYEGDIIRLDAHQDFFVDFHEGCFVCRSTNEVQRINWSPSVLRNFIENGYEVIGNIYENPELISPNETDILGY